MLEIRLSSCLHSIRAACRKVNLIGGSRLLGTAGRKPFPIAFRDHFDCSIANDDSSLIVKGYRP